MGLVVTIRELAAHGTRRELAAHDTTHQTRCTWDSS